MKAFFFAFKESENLSAPISLFDRLNKKERRLFDYLLDENNSRKIGDICKALHTTSWTLLSKTQPNLERKCDEFNAEYLKWCEEIGIEP